MSRTDHITSPMPSMRRLFAIPLIEAPLGNFLMLPGTKSLLSKVTLWLVPESQITLKLSIGSMAALHATGCCRTTASERRQLHSCDIFGVVGKMSMGEILGESLGEPIGLSVGDSMGVPVGISLGESMGISLGVQFLGDWNKG